MKKVIIVIVIIALAGLIGYKYVYQSHRDIQNEEAAYTLDAISIAKEFSENQKAASDKYLNKTIVVSGEVTEKEENAVTIGEAIYSTFDDTSLITGITTGETLKIKGRCIGYDELLEVIKMDQAAIIE